MTFGCVSPGYPGSRGAQQTTQINKIHTNLPHKPNNERRRWVKKGESKPLTRLGRLQARSGYIGAKDFPVFGNMALDPGGTCSGWWPVDHRIKAPSLHFPASGLHFPVSSFLFLVTGVHSLAPVIHCPAFGRFLIDFGCILRAILVATFNEMFDLVVMW